MLKDRITQRVLKHHGELLACMDALEEIGKAISESATPATEFNTNRGRLDQLVGFLSRCETQHEREEESILIPLLGAPDPSGASPASAAFFRQLCREHDQGQRFLKDIQENLQQLEEEQPQDPAEYYRFTSHLTDLVWHYRRHVWRENSLLTSPEAKPVPDSPNWHALIGSLGPRTESRDE